MGAVFVSIFAVGLGLLAITVGCAIPPSSRSDSQPALFNIGLIGDQHYDAESIAKFPNIMASNDSHPNPQFEQGVAGAQEALPSRCDAEQRGSKRLWCAR